ncbi:TolC family protein [Sphingobacterium endophyticum]|uniref:TolC family protein n=1 Tax=Sphingobacterium endophyticum TaxID=2546448 RepID=UPI0012E27A72|nr:TolC family protein [Sphingobacterium endophyticum]
MKEFISCILLLILCSQSSTAQSLSIEELWKQKDKSSSIQQKRLNVDAQIEQLNIRKSERIPIIYGDANLQRNLIIPITPVPAIAFDPNAAEGAILPLKFSTKWNSKAGLQLEWNLFNPNAKSQKEEDVLAFEKAKIEELKEIDNWKLNATLAYASIVLATKQYQVALEDSILYSEINQVNLDRYSAGRGSSEELILSQQELERKRIRLYESFSILQEANLELNRYYYNEDVNFLSSDMDEIINSAENQEFNKFDYELIELDQRLSNIQLRGIKRQVLPSFTFNAYFGSQFFNNELNLLDKSNWYGYSYANIGLKIPISAYFTNSSSVKKSLINEKIYAAQLEEIKINDEIDNKQKLSKINFAKQKLEGLSKIFILAERQKKEKLDVYQSGRILLSEFNKVNSDYLKAQQDVWQAEFDLLNTILE